MSMIQEERGEAESALGAILPEEEQVRGRVHNRSLATTFPDKLGWVPFCAPTMSMCLSCIPQHCCTMLGLLGTWLT
jgi:hypothetical protein